MAGFDVSYGENGSSLTIWFDHPHKATVIEEIGSDVILKKDGKGHIVGVEHLSYFGSTEAAAGVLAT